jgi:tetratricopeptide (TPR) repeat protein
MNRIRIFTSFRIAFLAFLLGSISFVVAANPRIIEQKTDKVTLKTREAVSKASPDDWYTFAEAAEKCINKGVNLNEASQWLERSLEIKETSYNLSVKGDYYMANRLPEKALKYYVKSIEVGKEETHEFDVSAVQKKIAAIIFKK